MAEGSRRGRLVMFLFLPAILAAAVVIGVFLFRASRQTEQLRQRSVVEATLTLVNEKVDRLDRKIIDQDNVEKLARDRQVSYTDFSSLARSGVVRETVGGEIEAVNRKLARIEQIKDFRVIDRILTAEDEELTPTMKMKRRIAAVKYAALIDGMYPDRK